MYESGYEQSKREKKHQTSAFYVRSDIFPIMTALWVNNNNSNNINNNFCIP